MAEEKTLSTINIFRGRAFSVRVDTVINALGEKATREIVEHAECIAVVAVDDAGKIFLVKQYRKGAEKELLEIPAGMIDPGEDPDTAVKRELQEEIGCVPERIKRIIEFYSSPGFCTEKLYLYFANDLKESRLIAEDTAGIQIVKISPDQILPLIRSGEICDSKTIAGLLCYLEKAKL